MGSLQRDGSVTDAVDFVRFIENWGGDRERVVGTDFVLPLPFARLTVTELAGRLRYVLGSVDFFWGLTLAHQLFVLMEAWEDRYGQTSLDIYRTALRHPELSVDAVLVRTLEHSLSLAHAIDAAVLATVWREAIAVHLPVEKRQLAAPISKVLCDILSEPEEQTAH